MQWRDREGVQVGRLTTSVQETLQKILRMKRLFNPRKKSEHECPQVPNIYIVTGCRLMYCAGAREHVGPDSEG